MSKETAFAEMSRVLGIRVPPSLGAITKLVLWNGKVVVETASGVPMIVGSGGVDPGHE